eukprot:10307120-Alexandrium_andersonii.AAC.1
MSAVALVAVLFVGGGCAMLPRRLSVSVWSSRCAPSWVGAGGASRVRVAQRASRRPSCYGGSG